jgi:low temperature requirement protein LtrA
MNERPPRVTLVREPHLRSAGGLEAGRRVTWLELFFDLVFVGAVAQVGTHLRDDYTLAGVLRYSLLFVLIWWAWLGHTTYSTRFDTDDLVQRVLTGLQMFLAIVMAINATGSLDSRDSAGFAAAYSVMRLVLVLQYLRVRTVTQARALTSRLAAGCAVAALLWLVSAFVEAPARFWIWGLALVVDVGTPLCTTSHLIRVPHDAAHLPERYGLFSIILLGESVVAVMAGMQSQEYWSPWAASAAILGLVFLFLVWWWYFDGVEAVAERFVRSSKDAVRFHVWSYGHLPLYLGIAVTGVGLEHVIRTATDAPLLAEEAWVLLAAAATLMAAMSAISATSHRRARGRSTRRAHTVAAVLSLTPLALALVATHLMPAAVVAGLTLVGVVQLWLALRPGEAQEARA